MDSIVTPKDNIILVPTDFSTSANFALEHSVEIAKLFDNEITLLYVVEENFLTNLFGNSIEKSVMLDTVNKKLIEKADELKAKHPGLIVNAMVREGKPYTMIVEAA